MYILYVIGCFVALLLFSIIRKKWAVSSYIIAIYLFTLLVALTIETFFSFYEESKKGSIIYVSAISLFLLPYLRKEPKIVEVDNYYSKKKIINIVKRISILMVFLEIMIIPAIINNAQAGFVGLREGEGSYQGNFVISFFIKIMDIFNPLSFVLLTTFFYIYTFFECKKQLLVLVFLASLSAPYYGIMSGGRTQMIYWLLSLGFNFLLFYKYLNPLKRKKLVKFVIVVVSIILLYISIATISRFSGSNWGTENSLLIYMGQSYLNFCYFIDNFPPANTITLRRIFPLSYSFLYGVEDPGVYYNEVLSRTGMDIGVFYTLLGDLFIDVGIVGMYFYAIVYYLTTTFLLRKKSLDLSSLLIVSLLFLIPLQGVFYYSFWKRQVTFCAILVLAFSRYIKQTKVSKK